jgi:glycosyltransferase involved in cell wall biosynthesis
MPIRVAFCTEVLAEYKLHLHHRLAGWPDYEVVVWHGPERPGTLPADADPGDAFPHRSARNLHFKLGLPLVWQRIDRELWEFDPRILILEDGVRILSNHRLLEKARRRGVPVILYSHGENLLRRRTRGRLFGEAVELVRDEMQRRASALVLYTEPSARDYRARHPDRAVFAANNTLDLDRIGAQLAALPSDHRERARAELGVPDGALLIASVGRMIPEHDPRRMAESVRRARAAGSRCHLLLIGGGPLEPAVRAWVDALPAGERPAFHALGRLPLDETTRWLAASDLFVLPGTIGLAIVHAFALGLPCLAAPVGVNTPEAGYLEPGRNGLMLSDLDGALVAALRRLEADPAEREALADGAARYAREQLSPARQVRGFVDAIEHVLGRGPAARRAAVA